MAVLGDRLLELRTPRPATGGVLGPFGPEVSWGVSPRVSLKTGVSLRGVSGARRAPGSGVSEKCPENVPRVSGTPF